MLDPESSSSTAPKASAGDDLDDIFSAPRRQAADPFARRIEAASRPEIPVATGNAPPSSSTGMAAVARDRFGYTPHGPVVDAFSQASKSEDVLAQKRPVAADPFAKAVPDPVAAPMGTKEQAAEVTAAPAKPSWLTGGPDQYRVPAANGGSTFAQGGPPAPGLATAADQAAPPVRAIGGVATAARPLPAGMAGMLTSRSDDVADLSDEETL